MAETIQYQSALPNLLAGLIGTSGKTSSSGGTSTSTSSSSANVDPLMAAFQQAMTSGSFASPDMQALIASIFQEGAQQVPTLTQQYANATGSRVSGNSGLQLALADLNRNLSTAAAQAVLTNQTQNNQIAANAANGVANATKTSTTTETKAPTSTTTASGANTKNAGVLGLLGTLANVGDKKGLFDFLKSGSAGAGASVPWTTPSFGTTGGNNFGLGQNVLSTPSFSDAGGDFGISMNGGGIDTGADLGGNIGIDTGADLGGYDASFDLGAGDIAGVGDAGWGMDLGFDGGGGFGTGDDWGNLDLGSFFRNGGKVAGRPMRGYADGGTVRNRNNMGARPATSPLVGAMNYQTPVNMDPSEAIAADATGNGTSIGGGTTITSNALRDQLLARQEAAAKMPQFESRGAASPTSDNPAGIGTPAQNAAVIGGFGATVLGGMTGVPAGLVSIGLNSLGVPSQTVSPMAVLSQMVAQAMGIGGAGKDANPDAVNGISVSNPGAGMQSTTPAAMGDILGNTPNPNQSMVAPAPVDLVAAMNAVGANDAGFGIDSATDVAGFGLDGNQSVAGMDGSLGMSSNPNGSISGIGLSPADLDALGGMDGGGVGPGDAGVGDSAGASNAGVAGGNSAGDASSGDGGTGGGDGSGTGGGTASAKNGGKIKGPGTSTSDSIIAQSREPGGNPVRYSDGEIVIPTSVIAITGEDPWLELIRRMNVPR